LLRDADRRHGGAMNKNSQALPRRWHLVIGAVAILVFSAGCTADADDPPVAQDPLRGEAIEFYERELADVVEDDVRPQFGAP